MSERKNHDGHGVRERSASECPKHSSPDLVEPLLCVPSPDRQIAAAKKNAMGVYF